jgi:hypothetical protein
VAEAHVRGRNREGSEGTWLGLPLDYYTFGHKFTLTRRRVVHQYIKKHYWSHRLNNLL